LRMCPKTGSSEVYKLRWSRQAKKDSIIAEYTGRINRQDRFVYTVEDNTEEAKDEATGELYKGIVYIHRMWGHYPIS